MHVEKQLRLGLFDPGFSAIDSVDLAPVFDLDFTQGRPYAHRIINKTAATATRASAANRYWLQPADDLATNVLRYAQKSTINRLNGLLIEGADQNVIIRNYFGVGQAGDWTSVGGVLGLLEPIPNLYSAGCFSYMSVAGNTYCFQTVALTAVKWIVAVLAYTDGSAVTAADIQVAAGASGAIAGLASTYEHLGGGVYFVWAVFTATAANWDVGIKTIPAFGTTFFSLLSCYLAAPTNEGGDYPRSPIPNATGAAITRAADVYTHPANDNIGLAAGTIDVEFVVPCSEAEAAAPLRIVHIYSDMNNRMGLNYNNTTNVLEFSLRTTVSGALVASAAAAFSRGDLVKLRAAYGVDIEGAKDLILYISINNAAWTELGSHNGPYAEDFPAGATIYFGRPGYGNRHLGSFIRRVRIFDYAKVGVPGW